MAQITKVEIRCDRCGKADACEIAARRMPVGTSRITLVVREETMTRESLRDLCAGCTSEFERFMKGERLESGWVDPESLKPR